ncbi:helix-turn-helix transcriptional regulator [Actinomycetospora sp.]|uniref:helix-turn-helix transcriptional regulator n=1 Tax=Actinomycetospora sp. TaxID=1872135 RepID=UPI002F3ED0A6
MTGRTSTRLPAFASSFVGRAAERTALSEGLARSRLVSLVGPGGAGKSRLAVEVVRDLPDVVGFVELAAAGVGPRPAGDVALAVLDACGVRDDPELTPAARLVGRLRDAPGVLVVDGCEHRHDEVAALVATLLRGCPDLRVLATSRRRLGVLGEEVQALGALEDDGTALFAARARAVRPDLRLDDDAVAAICRLAEGLPLAVELAAGHARVLALEDITAGMADRLRFAAADDPGLAARHRSLGACIAWGVAAAGAPAARALAALSVIGGRFTMAAAAGVAGDDAPAVATLVEHSLVTFDPADGRYRLLDSVREHAAELLLADGTGGVVHTRLGDWVATLAAELAPGLGRAEPDALARLDRDRAAVHAALRRAAATGSRLDRAADVVADLAFGWSLRGRCAEGRELADGVHGALVHPPPRLRWALAFLTAYAGDLGAGVALALEAAEHASAAGDAQTHGRALTLVGMVQMFVDPAGADPVLAEAVTLAVGAGDDWGEVESRQMRAYSCLLRCADAEALRYADQALPALDRLGHPQLRAWDGAIRAEIACRAARYDHAEACGRAALEMALGVAEPVSAGAGLLPVVRALAARGRADDAAALVAEVRPFFTTHPGVGTALVVELAEAVAAVARDPVAALGPVDALRAAAGSAGLPAVDGELAVLAATCALLAGHPDAAASAAVDAARAADAIGHREIACAALLTGAAAERAAAAPGSAEREGAARRAHAALTAAAVGGLEGLVPDALDLVAGVALDAARVMVAARLHAAADRRRDELGAARSPLARALLADRDAVAAALPAGARREAVAAGARLDRNRAVTYALRARGTRHRPTSGWESLTPTEREVVDLVGTGLTNAAVGEALLISAGTVRTHLRSVFAKLDVTSRTELAALAARREGR